MRACVCVCVCVCTCVWMVRLQGVYTDILQIVHMPDADDTQESVPTIPSYAVTDVASAKDKKKGKKVCMYVYVFTYSVSMYVCSYTNVRAYVICS